MSKLLLLFFFKERSSIILIGIYIIDIIQILQEIFEKSTLY